jgi:hypothetical protein
LPLPILRGRVLLQKGPGCALRLDRGPVVLVARCSHPLVITP